ncbi:MAG: hypothetical protein GX754_07930, partial [Clostridiaceae bacterium]|nr:hypothetical protein [Clostridiaceae bacterium]
MKPYKTTMKAYKDYMDGISVPGALHQKIVSCAANTGNTGPMPVHRPVMVKRYAVYAAVFACLTVILLGVFTVSWILQHKAVPVPGNDPLVSQSGKDPGELVTDAQNKSPANTHIENKYALFFNK